MRRTTLVVDDEVLRQAQDALGTKGIKETVDRALQQAIAADAGPEIPRSSSSNGRPGFNLFAGTHQVNRHCIKAGSSYSYRYAAHWTGKGQTTCMSCSPTVG